MALLLIYLAIALVFSFLCSLLEASLLSITPAHVNILNKEGTRTGKDLQTFKDNIDRPLSAILTLNTFAHTIGAAGVGSQAQKIWGEESVTIASIILTILVLILTEIIPKTLGANYWKQLTPFTISTLKFLILILSPIIWVTQLITKNFKKDKNKSILSRSDFTTMAELAIEEGVLNSNESKLLTSLLVFNKFVTSQIMTPRIVVRAANQHQNIKDFYENKENLKFSRIPVYESSIDNITGFVLKDEVLQHIINGEDLKLSEIKRQIIFTEKTTPVADLFNLLMEKKEHIAVVSDNYGGTSGIVTIEDIIETILDLEITDEFDDVEDMQEWAKEKWRKTAMRHDINLTEN